ncbi:ExeA family protein [Halochromatium sp.]
MTSRGRTAEPSAAKQFPTETESCPGVNGNAANDELMMHRLRGRVERVINGQLCGWLFDPAAPDKRLHIELLIDDEVSAGGIADQPRDDLASAGIGDGAHAFALTLDEGLLDGQPHELIVRAVDSGEPLPGNPIVFCDTSDKQTGPRVRGQFDRVANDIAHGWAFDPDSPEQRLQIAIYCQDKIVGQGNADRFRQDLLDAGIGDGAYAFELQIDPEQSKNGSAAYSAQVVDHETWLPGSPMTPEPEPLPISELETELKAQPAVAQTQEEDASQQPPSPESPSTEPVEAALRPDNPPQPAFENTRDTRFFFPSSAHAEALSRLFLLAQDRNMGIGLLTGEIGSGKTLLRTLLYARLTDSEHLRVSIENSLLDFDGLLLEILSQIQGERLAASNFPDRYTRLAAFKRLLSEQVASRNRHLVILVDEAQQLATETIEGLKALTNIASERQNFLTLILIGQPELRTKLKQLPQVDQRISLRFHLEGLDRAETGYYIRHRLRVAGFRGEPPVTEHAVQLVHQATRGIPREINRLCKLALAHLITHNGGKLDEETVSIIVDDLRRHGSLEEIANEL